MLSLIAISILLPNGRITEGGVAGMCMLAIPELILELILVGVYL